MSTSSEYVANDLDKLHDKAETLFQRNCFQGASDIYHEIIKLNPQHVESLLRLSEIARLLGDMSDSLQFAKKALKYAPKHSLAHAYVGMYHHASENYLEAIRCYEIALHYDVGNLSVWSALHQLCLASDDLDRFRTLVNRLYQQYPDQPYPLYFHGLFLLDDQRYHEAVDVFQNVIRLAPGFSEGYYQLSNAYYWLGQWIQ